MGDRTQYTPGTFCWVDLATTDVEGAKSFYSGLLGWSAEDVPVGDGAVYSMQRVDGKDVAAIAAQPEMQRAAGAPPAWQCYVSVESADAVAGRAKELGANVHADAFDVLEAGRMAVIQDPQGAYFMVWEPRRHFGASLVNATGALCWNELSTPDTGGSKSFYGDLFGWSLEPFEGSPEEYYVIKNGGANNGGVRVAQEGEPPFWLAYFAVDDIDASLAKLDELGGSKHVGPVDIGVAKVAVAQDPQGAWFALYAGDLEP